jgi:hypothetical protein
LNQDTHTVCCITFYDQDLVLEEVFKSRNDLCCLISVNWCPTKVAAGQLEAAQ